MGWERWVRCTNARKERRVGLRLGDSCSAVKTIHGQALTCSSQPMDTSGCQFGMMCPIGQSHLLTRPVQPTHRSMAHVPKDSQIKKESGEGDSFTNFGILPTNRGQHRSEPAGYVLLGGAENLKGRVTACG